MCESVLIMEPTTVSDNDGKVVCLGTGLLSTREKNGKGNKSSTVISYSGDDSISNTSEIIFNRTCYFYK